MKKMIATLILSSVASILLAGGPLSAYSYSGTNYVVTYTNPSQSPVYIERVDVRCSTANTVTVSLVNFTGIVNTPTAVTNAAMDYAPTIPLRLESGKSLSVTFGMWSTNVVAVYPVQK